MPTLTKSVGEATVMAAVLVTSAAAILVSSGTSPLWFLPTMRSRTCRRKGVIQWRGHW